MQATTQSRPIDDTYADMEGVIAKVVKKFHDQYGGDMDEMYSLGSQVFMRVYQAYDPSRGAISSLLWRSLWNELLCMNDSRIKKSMISLDRDDFCVGNGRDADLPLSQQIPDTSVSEFNFSEFASELTEDAKTVLQMVLDTPEELARMIGLKGGTPRSWRSSIRETLQKAGWCATRINEGFDEIRLALVAR